MKDEPAFWAYTASKDDEALTLCKGGCYETNGFCRCPDSFLPAVYSQETRISAKKEALTVADQYYWTGSEGNLAIELAGKFQSEAKLADTLNFTKEIGEFKAKKDPFQPKTWTLRDVLISVDFNANGSVATGRVSGPKPLIQSYCDQLKELYEDKTVFYDFSYRLLAAKPTAD